MENNEDLFIHEIFYFTELCAKLNRKDFFEDLSLAEPEKALEKIRALQDFIEVERKKARAIDSLHSSHHRPVLSQLPQSCDHNPEIMLN